MLSFRRPESMHRTAPSPEFGTGPSTEHQEEAPVPEQQPAEEILPLPLLASSSFSADDAVLSGTVSQGGYTPVSRCRIVEKQNGSGRLMTQMPSS